MPLIRKLLWALPPRIASSLCYRLFARNGARFADYFDAAPLRYAPQTRMRLNRGDWAHVSIAFMGAYELPLTRLIVSAARRSPGGLLVDVGANYGYFSLLWASLHPSNRVIAFEPAAANAAALSANARANCLADRIELIAAAAGRERKLVGFTQNAEQSGWNHIVDTASADVMLPMVTLDQTLPPSRGRVAVLKIDTEGHDWDVLDGSTRLFADGRVDLVVFECDASDFYGAPGSRWREIAPRHGYRLRPFEGERAKDGLMSCVIERDHPQPRR